MIAEGHSAQEIAELLTISPVTVQNHRAQVMKKLGLANLTELVRYAVRLGLTTIDS